MTQVLEAPEVDDPAELTPRDEDKRTIHERMVAIIDELPAIGKTRENKEQRFMFRGHDDVMNALNPLLAKHGVFIVPNVIGRTVSTRTTNRGSTMYEVNLHVEFTFYGLLGDSFTASGWGEGTDMGDKATNKAMTGAMKYVVAQTFALATAETSDADSTTPEETTREASGPPRARPEGRAPFDPGTQVLPDAPRGDDWAERLTEIQGLLASDLDWTAMLHEAAAQSMTDREQWGENEKAEFRRRWANTITNLRMGVESSDEWGGPELGLRNTPEAEALIVQAFAWGFKGAALKTPLPRIGAQDAPIRPQTAEEVEAQPDSQDASATPENANGEAGEEA